MNTEHNPPDKHMGQGAPGVSRGVQEGSRNHMLMMMEVGDYRYIETTAQDYAHTMRTFNTPKTRRPIDLLGREFTCKAYTAVGTAVGDVKVLVRIERTE